jgi:ribonuclease T2
MVKFVVRVAFIACFLACFIAAASTPATAQDTRQDQAGQFDFYLLSLSWSPSFCAAAAERADGRPAGMQWGARPYAFIVHGLWPQYAKGFPQYCQVPAPRLDRGTVSSMLDLMPARHLIFNEWDKHGTCSGLSPQAYFETVRKARAVVKIPPEYIDLQQPLRVTPGAVADAFIKANSGLSQAGIAVDCDSKRLTEVRLCLAKDLQFRNCPELVRRSCRRDQVIMPPVRGG